MTAGTVLPTIIPDIRDGDMKSIPEELCAEVRIAIM
jgi:hypothetical protein